MPKLTPIRMTETIELTPGNTLTYSRVVKSICQCAAYLGVSRWTVTRHIDGKITHTPLKRYDLVYLEDEESSDSD
jgi:hypothetical protein